MWFHPLDALKEFFVDDTKSFFPGMHVVFFLWNGMLYVGGGMFVFGGVEAPKRMV